VIQEREDWKQWYSSEKELEKNEKLSQEHTRG
jgi:hypothetical protein